MRFQKSLGVFLKLKNLKTHFSMFLEAGKHTTVIFKSPTLKLLFRQERLPCSPCLLPACALFTVRQASASAGPSHPQLQVLLCNRGTCWAVRCRFTNSVSDNEQNHMPCNMTVRPEKQAWISYIWAVRRNFKLHNFF